MMSNDSTTAGRTCPLHYQYGPSVFQTPASEALSGLDVLYVVGGLYGNDLALDAVLALFERESGRKQIVFNGDFHWFDTDPDRFNGIQQRVLQHKALRGNVETELADPSPDPTAGCGCAYPEWVGDGVVERSNRILDRLRQVTDPTSRRELAALPMWLTASVGDARVGIVHGDAQSLAGWGFAQEHLRDAAFQTQAREWFGRAEVDIFASSHTCLPVFQALQRAGRAQPSWILNNGAAGMPNFRSDPAGMVTRIAVTPFQGSGHRCGVVDGPLHMDLIALEFDPQESCERFLRQWPDGSEAHESYFSRIVSGPDYTVNDVIRKEF